VFIASEIIQKLTKPYNVIALYNYPSSEKKFRETFETIIDTFNSEELIVIGDVNIDLRNLLIIGNAVFQKLDSIN
jgi:hypothetical protein